MLLCVCVVGVVGVAVVVSDDVVIVVGVGVRGVDVVGDVGCDVVVVRVRTCCVGCNVGVVVYCMFLFVSVFVRCML